MRSLYGMRQKKDAWDLEIGDHAMRGVQDLTCFTVSHSMFFMGKSLNSGHLGNIG